MKGEEKRRKFGVDTIDFAIRSTVFVEDGGGVQHDATTTVEKELKLAYKRGFNAGRDGVKK